MLIELLLEIFVVSSSMVHGHVGRGKIDFYNNVKII